MKKVVYLPVIIMVLLLLSAAVYAQYYPDYETNQPNWNLHLGAAWNVGDTPDNVEIIVGLGYETSIDYENLTWLGFSADYIPIDTNGRIISQQGMPVVYEGGGTVSYVPALMYLKRYAFVGGIRVFGMVGIGMAWAEDDIPEMQIGEGTNFAWMVGGGLDWGPSFFGQIRYLAGEHAGDDGIVTTELGFRF